MGAFFISTKIDFFACKSEFDSKSEIQIDLKFLSQRQRYDASDKVERLQKKLMCVFAPAIETFDGFIVKEVTSLIFKTLVRYYIFEI